MVDERRKIAPCFWTNIDVLNWMKDDLPEFFQKYAGFFKTNDIGGRTLFLLTDSLLIDLGIVNAEDRSKFQIEIYKLKLKSNLLTLKNEHRKGNIRFITENPAEEEIF